MAENYLRIECPKCKTILIVDRITGALIETREPLVADSSGDRFTDAVKKIKEDAQAAEEKFRQARAAEKTKHADLEAMFQKSLEQVKKEGPPKKDVRDIDLD